jgi:hypothetical protein
MLMVFYLLLAAVENTRLKCTGTIVKYHQGRGDALFISRTSSSQKGFRTFQ